MFSNLDEKKCDHDIVILEDSNVFENAAEVIEALQQKHKSGHQHRHRHHGGEGQVKILNLNMLNTSMTELIAKVSCAKTLLAFHTPYLVMAIFLPKLHSGTPKQLHKNLFCNPRLFVTKISIFYARTLLC